MGSERLGGNHASEDAQDVVIGCLLNCLADVAFGVQFARVFNCDLFLGLLGFLINALGPFNRPLGHLLKVLVAMLGDSRLVFQLQSVVPLLFVKIQQHFLFQLVCLVVDVD